MNKNPQMNKNHKWRKKPQMNKKSHKWIKNPQMNKKPTNE